MFAGQDLDQLKMQEIVIDCTSRARLGCGVVLLCGHALQFESINYLMPIDVTLADETDLRRLVRIDELVKDLQAARNLSILVLDACRDNPLAEVLRRSVGSSRAAVSLAPGLAQVDSREGLLISFATQAGRTADDGDRRNSPYTEAFLRHIETPEEIGPSSGGLPTTSMPRPGDVSGRNCPSR